MVAMIDEALGKRKRYGEPSTRATTPKCAHHFFKNGYGFRGMAVTSMSATFGKISILAFCVYTWRSLVPLLNFYKTKISFPYYGYAHLG